MYESVKEKREIERRKKERKDDVSCHLVKFRKVYP